MTGSLAFLGAFIRRDRWLYLWWGVGVALLYVSQAWSVDGLYTTQAEFAADGFAVGCFRPPSVPDGVSRIRLTAKASLTDTDARRVLDRLRQVVQAR